MTLPSKVGRFGVFVFRLDQPAGRTFGSRHACEIVDQSLVALFDNDTLTIPDTWMRTPRSHPAARRCLIQDWSRRSGSWNILVQLVRTITDHLTNIHQPPCSTTIRWSRPLSCNV